MNINKIGVLLLFISFLGFSIVNVNGQSGLAITAGMGLAKNQLSDISKGYGVGYTAALEARFLGQDMYFDVQLGYGKYRLITDKAFQFASSDNNMQVIHGRIGMGFTLWRISEKILLRAKILGSLDQNYQFTSKALENKEHKKINNATVGMLGGIGIDFHRIVVDFEYEKGLINAFYKVPGSNFDYIGLRAGILIN